MGATTSPSVSATDRAVTTGALPPIISGRNVPHAVAQSQNAHSASSGQVSTEAAQRKAGPEMPRSQAQGAQVFELIPGRLSFTAHASLAVTYAEIEEYPERFYFSANYQERYAAFCLDFGPVNLAVVHKFCGFVRKFWTHKGLQNREMVYYTGDTFEKRTNTAFLLAAFMVVDLGYTPEDAWAPFARMPEGTFATFRDATFCEQKYGLTVLACLQGLQKAVSLGWYDPRNFSVDAYQSLESAQEGDMHWISPKFIAFKGPVDPSAKPTDDVVDEYALPAKHYAKAFRDMGVTGVVRLNEASTYNSKAFTDEGVNHHELYFDDCTMPNRGTVRAFLAAVEKEEGVVAVHCRAGLGRTGTLIAVYLMKHHGFKAAEAIGWLRIVRPGSVIGDQQHFLHWYEATRGGTVESSLLKAQLFHLNVRRTKKATDNVGAEELGRMVKQAQVDKAKRLETAVGPPSQPDCRESEATAPRHIGASADATAQITEGRDCASAAPWCESSSTGKILKVFGLKGSAKAAPPAMLPMEQELDCRG